MGRIGWGGEVKGGGREVWGGGGGGGVFDMRRVLVGAKGTRDTRSAQLTVIPVYSAYLPFPKTLDS